MNPGARGLFKGAIVESGPITGISWGAPISRYSQNNHHQHHHLQKQQHHHHYCTFFIIMVTIMVIILIMVFREQAKELAALLGAELNCYTGGEWLDEVCHHHHHWNDHLSGAPKSEILTKHRIFWVPKWSTRFPK